MNIARKLSENEGANALTVQLVIGVMREIKRQGTWINLICCIILMKCQNALTYDFSNNKSQ